VGDDLGGDGLGDTSDTDGELLDDEVGNFRAGRLVAGEGGTPNSSPPTSVSTVPALPRRPRSG
jgi:hypothetical protein